jgi:hypothetical protein
MACSKRLVQPIIICEIRVKPSVNVWRNLRTFSYNVARYQTHEELLQVTTSVRVTKILAWCAEHTTYVSTCTFQKLRHLVSYIWRTSLQFGKWLRCSNIHSQLYQPHRTLEVTKTHRIPSKVLLLWTLGPITSPVLRAMVILGTFWGGGKRVLWGGGHTVGYKPLYRHMSTHHLTVWTAVINCCKGPKLVNWIKQNLNWLQHTCIYDRVNFALGQATKAQRKSRSIPLLFL